jgi:hypothetical protein
MSDKAQNNPSQPESEVIWGEHELPRSRLLRIAFGPLRLLAQARSNELWLHNTYMEASDPKSKSILEEDTIKWSRWAFNQTPQKILLTPALPDKATVVKPDFPFKVAPSATARVFVKVPLWVKVTAIADQQYFVTDLSSVILSNTWFGVFTQGELCYWLTTSARRSIDSSFTKSYLAVCPVQIINQSEEELDFEKICLRVSSLSLYQHEKMIWASETVVNYRGAREPSNITVGRDSPKEVPEAKLIADPREPAPRGFAARTFSSLRTLTGLGV